MWHRSGDLNTGSRYLLSCVTLSIHTAESPIPLGAMCDEITEDWWRAMHSRFEMPLAHLEQIAGPVNLSMPIALMKKKFNGLGG
jgi:hypothetical protein